MSAAVIPQKEVQDLSLYFPPKQEMIDRSTFNKIQCEEEIKKATSKEELLDIIQLIAKNSLAQGWNPDINTDNSILQFYIKNGLYAQAESLLRSIKINQTYNIESFKLETSYTKDNNDKSQAVKEFAENFFNKRVRDLLEQHDKAGVDNTKPILYLAENMEKYNIKYIDPNPSRILGVIYDSGNEKISNYFFQKYLSKSNPILLRRDLKAQDKLRAKPKQLDGIYLDQIDCHGLSQSGALAMVRYYIKKDGSLKDFRIITGKGNHGNNPLFSMRKKVQDLIQDQLKDLIAINEINDGDLVCSRRVKRLEQKS